MITIYGSPKSSSGRCFWTLEEIGLEYATKSIDFQAKEHKSAEFLKVNPNGKVPVLTDGDYKIWESMAINMYLCDEYRPELLGQTSKERGLSYQWSIWALGDLQTPLIDIFIQLVFVPEERRDLSKIEKAKEKLPALLDTLENTLKESKYLTGDSFTLADLNTASVVHICEHIKFDLSDYSHIKSWLKMIDERPAFQRFKALCK